MFTTPTQLHNAFLDGIRKSSTTTVKPSVFCRIWNEWALLEWVKGNNSMREGVELTQKQIDDISHFYVRCRLTGPVNSTFNVPDGTITGLNLVTNVTEILPKYMRALVVRFSLNYGANGNSCGKTGFSGPLKCKYLRADEEGVIMESVYRKPADHRLYYKIIQVYQNSAYKKKIVFIGGESAVYQCYLDYVRYPNEMTVASEALSYTIDLSAEQLSEVVALAVKIYLERVTDPRYKSFLNEEMIRQTSQV